MPAPVAASAEPTWLAAGQAGFACSARPLCAGLPRAVIAASEQ